jgi:hypothetical protein
VHGPDKPLDSISVSSNLNILLYHHNTNTTLLSLQARSKMCLPCFSFSKAQYERGNRQPVRQYQYVWNGQTWLLRDSVSSSDFLECRCAHPNSRPENSCPFSGTKHNTPDLPCWPRQQYPLRQKKRTQSRISRCKLFFLSCSQGRLEASQAI